jgi:hypothetical protein
VDRGVARCGVVWCDDYCTQEVSFTEIGQHQRPFPREMMSLRKWKRVKN